MSQTLVVICLILFLITQIFNLFLNIRVRQMDQKAFESKLKDKDNKIIGLEDKLMQSNKALIMASSGLCENAFVLTPKGIRVLPKNWESQIKWD